jgi:hypothetical protein
MLAVQRVPPPSTSVSHRLCVARVCRVALSLSRVCRSRLASDPEQSRTATERRSAGTEPSAASARADSQGGEGLDDEGQPGCSGHRCTYQHQTRPCRLSTISPANERTRACDHVWSIGCTAAGPSTVIIDVNIAAILAFRLEHGWQSEASNGTRGPHTLSANESAGWSRPMSSSQRTCGH